MFLSQSSPKPPITSYLFLLAPKHNNPIFPSSFIIKVGYMRHQFKYSPHSYTLKTQTRDYIPLSNLPHQTCQRKIKPSETPNIKTKINKLLETDSPSRLRSQNSLPSLEESILRTTLIAQKAREFQEQAPQRLLTNRKPYERGEDGVVHLNVSNGLKNIELCLSGLRNLQARRLISRLNMKKMVIGQERLA